MRVTTSVLGPGNGRRGVVAQYSLDRLSVLLVEDNAYIREVLESLLRHLGVGHVTTARDGKDAIDWLRLLGSNPATAGTMALDLIIADLVMSPINGLLLLQWVRGNKASPNRFLPFVMISGAADADYVAAARDMGVTEFLAKPFSVQSVSQRLMQVIDHPRQYVATTEYFGPDRRRQKGRAPADELERRQKRDDDVTIVYSASKVVRPKTPSDVWYFRLPNALRDKVGGMGATGPGEFPTELLEKAEKDLHRSALDFADWATRYLQRLNEAVQDTAQQPAEHRHTGFENINLLAHELRGQGGTFGYPLITLFAKSLYETTQPGMPEDDNAIEIVKAHVDTMRAVIRDRVSGNGGKLGKELYESLQAAIRKHSDRVVG